MYGPVFVRNAQTQAHVIPVLAELVAAVLADRLLRFVMTHAPLTMGPAVQQRDGLIAAILPVLRPQTTVKGPGESRKKYGARGLGTSERGPRLVTSSQAEAR